MCRLLYQFIPSFSPLFCLLLTLSAFPHFFLSSSGLLLLSLHLTLLSVSLYKHTNLNTYAYIHECTVKRLHHLYFIHSIKENAEHTHTHTHIHTQPIRIMPGAYHHICTLMTTPREDSRRCTPSTLHTFDYRHRSSESNANSASPNDDSSSSCGDGPIGAEVVCAGIGAPYTFASAVAGSHEATWPQLKTRTPAPCGLLLHDCNSVIASACPTLSFTPSANAGGFSTYHKMMMTTGADITPQSSGSVDWSRRCAGEADVSPSVTLMLRQQMTRDEEGKERKEEEEKEGASRRTDERDGVAVSSQTGTHHVLGRDARSSRGDHEAPLSPSPGPSWRVEPRVPHQHSRNVHAMQAVRSMLKEVREGKVQ